MLRGELRRAERRPEPAVNLAESEARHRAIVGALPHGVVLQDAEGAVLVANPAAQRLLGPDTEHVAALPSHGSAMLALRSGQVQRRLTGPLTIPEQTDAWLAVTAVPLLDDDGTARAVVSTVIDATAEHEREIALRRSEEMFRQAME